MKILILGLNYAPERIGIAVYTTGMAEALAAKGHEVRVVAAQPYYPAWSVPASFRGGARAMVENGVTVTRIPLYVPTRPTGPRRVLHHLSFAWAMARSALPIARTWKPDLVWTVAPSLLSAPIARCVAARANAPAWLHVQDFEVEAAFATGLLGRRSLVGRFALGFQSWAMRGFALYSSISPQMCRRLRDLGIGSDRVVEFRNWANIDRVATALGAGKYRSNWAITTQHVALYSGNISNKQGIDIIIDVARRLASRVDLTFVVCGDGPQLATLKDAAADLTNIRFFPLQPIEQFPDLLSLATVHLLPQVSDAADLVLPSKLANILASGRPVIATAALNTGLAAEVKGCGLVVPPADPDAFAKAIVDLLDDDALRTTLGQAGQARAGRRWSRDAILGRFERQLCALASIKNDQTAGEELDLSSLTSPLPRDTSNA